MAWAPKTFDPSSSEPFTISRSKLDLFTDCPRCAYLDLRLGVKRVSGPSFTLNNAVDELLKREFDAHRVQGTQHPLTRQYGVNATPLNDPRMDEWRDALRRGIKHHHQRSNIILRGGVDDVWVDQDGQLMIVDYKATSKKEGPSTTDDLYDSYKKQIEIYQWLFRQNGFSVSNTGYFVYVNGKSDAVAFDGKLEFDVNLIAYTGNSDWVDQTLVDLKDMLMSESIPKIGKAFNGGPCDFCTYREAAGKALATQHAKITKQKPSSSKKESGTSPTPSLF